MKFLAAALLAGSAAAFTAPEAGRQATALNIGTPGASWGATLGPAPQAANIGDQQRILGQTRRTWQFPDITQELVEVDMTSDGRPMYSDINLWIGPDWTPMTMKTYSYDGYKRPLKCIIGTRNKQATIEVKNTGSYELPITCTAAYAKPPFSDLRNDLPNKVEGAYVEGGGAVHSVTFDPTVEQAQILLKTDLRQLNAKVEVLNAPNNYKQTFEIFTNNGVLNSLYVVVDTPQASNTVRVRNIAPLEFPFKAFISEV